MNTIEERLQHFGLSSAEIMDELMVLIPSSPDVTKDASGKTQALQRYIELVHHIGLLAWESELAGLQSVCALVETNLLLLQNEDRSLSASENLLLESWPMLLFGYLANRADQESSIALLQNLSTDWPVTLPEESYVEELQRLMGKTTQPATTVASPSNALLNVEAQQVEREVLSVLTSELAQMDQQFGADLLAATHGTPDEKLTALNECHDFVERLKLTVESVGLSALAALLAQLARQLATLTVGLSTTQLELLQTLLARLTSYLSNPNDETACAALVALIADESWPSPLARDAGALWQGALGNVHLSAGSEPSSARQVRARWEDVSLELPNDVNSELLDGLLQELPVQVASFSSAIALISSGQGSVQDAKQAMRSAHTLKGAANTVGVPGIANLAHHLEDILVALINAEMMPPPSLADVLVNASDCLEAMSEFLLGMGPPPDHMLDVLQAVLDQANRIDHDGISAASSGKLLPAGSAAAEPVADQESSASPPVIEQALRVPAPVVDELLRLAGESLISNSQIQDRLQMSLVQTNSMRKQQQLFLQLVAELEVLVDIRGVATTLPGAANKNSNFDALEFEHYSELQTISRQLMEAATDAQEFASAAEEQMLTLEELLEEQRRLQMANQHAVMRTRMVAVSSIVPRLQRGVRQTGRLLDKQVELVIKGEHTNIDSQVLSDLMDPLMHILRNSVDHGIETPSDRTIAGKPAQGRIELTFAREGNSIVVRCNDDGAGLDYEAISRIAERKGMLKPGHNHSEDELARLILAPGFSTREDVSHVSGRGVGMDVVYSRILAMKGTLALNSRRGLGLSIELRLPATLLSAHTLVIRQREKRLAISSRGVSDLRYVARDQIVQIGPRQFFRDGERMYGLVKLEDLLSMPHDRRAKDRHGFPVLLVQMDDGSVIAVLVQEIVDSREVVMKNFGRYVPRTQGVIGAIILGDGAIAPVIDLVELLRAPAPRPSASQLQGEAQLTAGQQPEIRALRALVVDDSISARRAVVQVLKDAGYDVRTANDGLDAVAILDKYIPDIILTDMEMPRMNGLELAANVRHSDRTRHVPIIMITSRSTEKHRQMSSEAGVNIHVIKPFNDDVLLQHIAGLTGR